MPNLDAANIALGIIRSLTDALLIGPFFTGFSKPAHVVIPSVSPRGIFNMSAFTSAELKNHILRKEPYGPKQVSGMSRDSAVPGAGDEGDPLTSVNPANLRLQIGLDPAGGTNPNGAGVFWSSEANPLNQYAPFTVSGTAVSNSRKRPLAYSVRAIDESGLSSSAARKCLSAVSFFAR